jgi:mono/diheme cytochrome c family protein
MDESLFYIAGGILIAVALILSLVGMRSDRFPSGNVLTAGLVVVFLLVAATAVGAVELAQHEEGERLEEANLEADAAEAEETAEGEEEGAAPAPTPGGEGGEEGGPTVEGSKVFVATGCGSCHTLAELGSDAQGTIGPNLDTALAGKDEAFIEESIVKPSANVAEGFPDGTMPATYGTELSPAQVDALVSFLSQSAGD